MNSPIASKTGTFARIALLSLFCVQAALLGASSARGAMEYVTVCDAKGNCRKLSRLIMGTDHLFQGGWVNPSQPQIPEDQAFAVLNRAAQKGINFVDSSPIYVGDAEAREGKWLRMARGEILKDGYFSDPSLNPDRRLYALSKGGFPNDLFYAKSLPAGTHSPELRAALIQKGILPMQATMQNGSLALQNVPPGTYASRLYGTKEEIARRVSDELNHTLGNVDDPYLADDLTVYLMHRDDFDFIGFDPVSRRQTPVKTIMEALASPELAQRFSLLGWSNWSNERVEESLRLAASDPNLPKPQFNSPYFSLFEMSPRSIHAGGVQVTHADMMNPNFQKGIRLNPYSPLGGFPILDQETPTWENAKRLAQEKHRQGDAYWKNVYPAVFTPENQARYDRVVKFTREFNQAHGTKYTVDQMVNAYALAHPRADFLTVGPITVEQVDRTVAALDLSKMLTPEDLDFLHSGTVKPGSRCVRAIGTLLPAR